MEAYKINYFKCKLVREKTMKLDSVRDSADVYQIIKRTGIIDAAEEYVYTLCLNVKGEVTGIHEISHGDLSSSSIHPREIYKRALLNNAAGIILCHNHPSGDPTPSDDDILATKRIQDAGKLLGIKLVDHVIVGSTGTYTSLRAECIVDY